MGSKTICRAFTAIIAAAALAFAHHHDKGGVDVDFALAFDDDIPVPAGAAGDSAAVEQFREELGQDFSSLFDGTDDDAGDDDFLMDLGIDTMFAWSNSTINSGRFDYRTLGPKDTIKIALVDSAQGRRYVHPHPGHITSRFGPRRFLWHYGTDTKLNTGDTVRVALDGIVRVIQFDRRGYGNVVVVRHPNGIETLYGHLHRVSVEPNQRIKAGEAVGLGGNTGRSTGAHLHFEIRYFGEPFSPEYIIDFQNARLKSDTLILTRDNFEYLTELRKQVIHTVRRGDNLGSIARRYGTSVNSLCRLNGITPRTTLRVGRRLVVRSGKEAERQVVSAEPSPTPVSETAADAAVDTAVDTKAGTPVDKAADTATDATADTSIDTTAPTPKSTIASMPVESSELIE